jgi:hypothetical protein
MTIDQSTASPSYWWVNQSKTYGAERDDGIMWAPKKSANGQTLSHWESLLDVAPGDRIVHYARGHIRAIGVAATSAIDSRRPPSIPGGLWDDDGRMVRVNSTDLAAPIALDDIDASWRHGAPFDKDGAVRQGYLYRLDTAFAKYLLTTFAELAAKPTPYAARFVPAEARVPAIDILRSLVGLPITTATGRTNTILHLDANNVAIATERSPSGQDVPINSVQQALDRIACEGTLTITPAEISYRSSFVGAVLLTLPGARVQGSPPTITFEPLSNDTSTPTAPPTPYLGATHKEVTSKIRLEQGQLRQRLIGAATFANCAICGNSYPVRFLWASHIKKRARCTDAELRDLSHIAMLACLFGCDVLFETGLISVDEHGHVMTAAVLPPDTPLTAQLDRLRGRAVTAFTTNSEKYFKWHRTNTFQPT